MLKPLNKARCKAFSGGGMVKEVRQNIYFKKKWAGSRILVLTDISNLPLDKMEGLPGENRRAPV